MYILYILYAYSVAFNWIDPNCVFGLSLSIYSGATKSIKADPSLQGQGSYFGSAYSPSFPGAGQTAQSPYYPSMQGKVLVFL